MLKIRNTTNSLFLQMRTDGEEEGTRRSYVVAILLKNENKLGEGVVTSRSDGESVRSWCRSDPFDDLLA